MRKVFCKKEYYFFDIHFEEGKYYNTTSTDRNYSWFDSCIIITNDGSSHRFYYNPHLNSDYPKFEMYFYSIEEIRKKKLKEIRKKKLKKIGINT